MSFSWENATSLNLLALNDLNLNGTVGPLPASLRTLYLHDNRLSGPLPANLSGSPEFPSSAAWLKQALVLIGNEFEMNEPPPWLRNSSDINLTAVTYNQKRDVQDLLVESAALPSLFLLSTCIVAMCLKRGLRAPSLASDDASTHRYLQLVKNLSVALAGLSLFCLCVLLPVYSTEGSFFEYGRPISRTSIAMLDKQGWLVASLLALYTAFLLFTVSKVHSSSAVKGALSPPVPSSAAVPPSRARGKRRFCFTAFHLCFYLVVLCVCACPTVMSVILESAPPKNRLGIPVEDPVFKLLFSNVAAPVVMVLSNSVVIPWIARSTAARFNSVPTAAAILVFVGLFINSLVTPSLAMVVFDSNCMRGFFGLWSLCESQNHQQLTSNITVDVGYGLFFFNVTVLEAKDICTGSQLRYGFCFRSIVGWVGPFMIRKFLYFAFLPPGLLLLRIFVCRNLACRRQQKAVQVSSNLPLLLSQFEVAAILGAFVPVLLPAALLGFITNLLVRRWSLLSFGSDVELVDGTSSLVLSRFLAYMFLSPILLSFAVFLFFWENSAAVLEGRDLPVLSGLPVAVTVLAFSVGFSTYLYFRVFRARKHELHAKLFEPLNSRESCDAFEARNTLSSDEFNKVAGSLHRSSAGSVNA